jgi:hypothetical protein
MPARNAHQTSRRRSGTGSSTPRFDAETGVPLVAVTARVAQLVAFFRGRLGETDEAMRLAILAGHEQCQACLESLNALVAQGAASIRPRQLHKLVAQASGSGVPNPLWPAEVGAAQSATQAGAVIEAAARVIWWQLTTPALPGPLPWSAAEVRALCEAGVRLPDTAQQLAQIARTWLRPVMAAREQLTLVLPPPGEEVHPLWQMVGAVVDAPRVTALEGLLRSGGEGMAVVTPGAAARCEALVATAGRRHRGVAAQGVLLQPGTVALQSLPMVAALPGSAAPLDARQPGR